MACNTDFVQYIADQCTDAGEITVKKMFGDYGIYCDGKIFGLICDDRLYVKPTEAGHQLLRTVELHPPYPGAKDYFYIADVDNREYLSLRRCASRSLRRKIERIIENKNGRIKIKDLWHEQR